MTPEKMLAELIRINTENPPGNETAAAQYLKDVFDRAGIPGQILEAKEGRGNYIATLGPPPGSGNRTLLFLSHSDVVPAGEGWDFDPFSGEIREDMVLGRGAMDCKGMLAAEACAVLDLARQWKGSPPGGNTLILAATADEERGGAQGIRYLMEHFPHLLQADFAVNEGAEEPIIVNGRMVQFIQVAEKGTSWSRLTTRGRSCHGSIPHLGDNAVMKMAAALQGLRQYRPETCFLPEVELLLQELSRLYEIEPGDNKHTLDRLLERLEDRAFAASLKAMTEMTVSANTIQGGHKTNVVPDTCRANLDIRVLPGQDESFVRRTLRRCLGEEIEIEIPRYQEPSSSDARSSAYRLLHRVTQELARAGDLCLPVISTGSTDSRILRKHGIPAYGVGHMHPAFDPEIKASVHGLNERIDIASLHLKTRFFTRLAQEYLGGESA